MTTSGKDLLPRPRVCLRPSGAGDDAWACHPGGAERNGPRLRVTTAGLTHEGIDLSVTRADGTTPVGTGVHHPAIGVAVLARG